MSGVSYLELLKLAAPETILVLTVLVVLAADLLALRGLELRFRLLIGAMISCVGCAAAIAWMLALPQHAHLPRRHAGGGSADPVRQGRAAGADHLHGAPFGGHGFHPARGRVLRA